MKRNEEVDTVKMEKRGKKRTKSEELMNVLNHMKEIQERQGNMLMMLLEKNNVKSEDIDTIGEKKEIINDVMYQQVDNVGAGLVGFNTQDVAVQQNEELPNFYNACPVYYTGFEDPSMMNNYNMFYGDNNYSLMDNDKYFENSLFQLLEAYQRLNPSERPSKIKKLVNNNVFIDNGLNGLFKDFESVHKNNVDVTNNDANLVNFDYIKQESLSYV